MYFACCHFKFIQFVFFQVVEEPVHFSSLPVHPLFLSTQDILHPSYAKAGEPVNDQSGKANSTPTCIPSVVPSQYDDQVRQSVGCNVVLTDSISVGLPSEGSVTGVNV